MEVKGVKLNFLGHSGFVIQNGAGKVIMIDPYNVSENVGKADIILITHSHYDHCSIGDIRKVAKNGSVIIISADSQSKIAKVEGVSVEIVEAGDEIELGKIRIEAVPAYTVNSDYHPKREGWLGYLIKINGSVVIYHSGDSDKIPEMNRLTGHGKHDREFVALLPVSGKFVMDVDEAVSVANLLSPDLCIPMHYGAGVAGTKEEALDFVTKCKEIGLNAVILEKI